MKKLYEVNLTYYIMAEDEDEARSIPQDMDECSADVDVTEATAVMAHWWDSIPFEGEDDKTCGQIITEMKVKSPCES